MLQLENRDALRARVYDDLHSLLGDLPDGKLDQLTDHVLEWLRPKYERMVVDFDRLPGFVKTDLADDAKENEYDAKSVCADSSPHEIFTKWLEWNGIINWSGRIRDALDGIRASSKSRKK